MSAAGSDYNAVCGRFNVSTDPLSKLLLELVGLRHPGPDNANAAPTEQIVVLRLRTDGAPELVPMRWWLTPYWAKEPSTRYSMFNAKSETAATSPAFREPLRRRRCVVPVSGFYEWIRQRGEKLPYYIRPHAEPGMLLAGIWDRWRPKGAVSAEQADAAGDAGEEVQPLESFAILTTAAAEGLEFVHTRQPVMLSMADARRWLDPELDEAAIAALLGPAIPVALDAVPVSSFVNNARNKGPRCYEPIAGPVPVRATSGPPA
ncbi:MAG: SOS response-associated peptidase [Pseudomonadales bacterium]